MEGEKSHLSCVWFKIRKLINLLFANEIKIRDLGSFLKIFQKKLSVNKYVVEAFREKFYY